MTVDMERSVVRLGGKGSSTLSSSSVFQVANGLAPLSIDFSALSRLCSDSSSSAASLFFSLPDYFTSEEVIASILLLLNKLLLLSPYSSFPFAAVAQLSDFFFNLNLNHNKNNNNNDPTPLDFKIDGISLDNPDYSLAAALDAISALSDHRSSALSPLVDAVAALSCEALGADISAFNLIDSGDGSSSKDDVSVASDFKVFFNGSKLVNSKVFDPSISKIPVVYGNFREICRLLLSRTRVQLSTAFKDGTAEVMSTVLSSLALSNLAGTSSRHANLLVESLPANDLRLILCSQHPTCIDSVQLYFSLQQALNHKDYLLFSHQVYSLLDVVRKTVCWVLEINLSIFTLGVGDLLRIFLSITVYRGSSGFEF